MKKLLSLFISAVVLAVCAFASIEVFAFDLPDGCWLGYLVHDDCEHEWEQEVMSDATCTDEGYMEISCSICGDYYYQPIPSKGHAYTTKTVKANASKKTNGYFRKYCKTCDYEASKTIYYYPKTVTLSTTSYAYNGKAKKPSVTVKDSNGKVINSTHYSVSYSNNTKPGKASVKITFKGNYYTGTITKYFKIKPKKASISSLKYNSKGKITVKWKKDANATGYIIQYSPNKKFAQKNTCTLIVSNQKTTSKAITSLPKKTYYVRVAAYKAVSGQKYRGEWSSTKKVAVKKGATLKQMINYTKTDLSGRDTIKSLTNKSVDIKKYDTTYDRIKAIYNWHAKNAKKFSSCMECNMNFNDCIYALYGTHKQYDTFIWLAAGDFKNSNGSVVIHKWSVFYIQGCPYIFDPRLQGYTGNYKGNTYFGITSSSKVGKKYLFDYWMFYWSNDASKNIV